MTLSYIKYFIAIIVLVFLQKTFIWLISLSSLNITPDLVIIVIVYIGIKEGKISGAIAGFIAGLLIDFLSGSFLGLQALSYSITAFIAGSFKKDSEKYLYKFNFLLIIFLCSLISNTIYYLIFFQGTAVTLSNVILKFVLTSSAYTTLISILYIFFPKRKKISEGLSY